MTFINKVLNSQDEKIIFSAIRKTHFFAQYFYFVVIPFLFVVGHFFPLV